MSRIGRISLIDHSLSIGEIVDEHDQDICFNIEESGVVMSIGSAVWFDIEIKDDKLKAVNVRLIEYPRS